MNYTKIYNSIICRARKRLEPEGYTESHHVVPRSMGGDDSVENIVVLTAREHYICHWLLTKIHKDSVAAVFAFRMMFVSGGTHNRYESGSKSRVFAKYRERFSSYMSEAQSGELNSQHGTRWIHSDDLRVSRKISKNDDLPQGWNEGRRIKWVDCKCVVCGCVFVKPSHPRKTCSKTCANELHKESLSGRDMTVNPRCKKCSICGVEYSSLGEASRILGVGHETLRMRIKSKNFEDYFWV